MDIAPSDFRKINANLTTSLAYLRPLELDGVILTCRQVHIDEGIYEVGRGAPVHRHEELQIEYAVTGAYVWSTKAIETPLEAGQYLVIPPGLLHEWRCTHRGILLGAELRITGGAERGFVRALREAFQGDLRRFHDEHTATWVGQMLNLARQPVPFAWRRTMIGSLLHLWFAQILKLAMPMEPWRQAIPYSKGTSADRSRLLVRQAIDFMQANYGLPIKLKDIAEQLGITPRHLTRLFAQYEQESVNANLLHIRLRRAREMLSTGTAHSMKEIAYACGFSSPSYFTQCFRKHYGSLPREMADPATAEPH